METIADRVKAKRKALKIKSHAELARRVSRVFGKKVWPQSIQQLEAGDIGHPKYLLALAIVLKTTPQELLTGTPAKVAHLPTRDTPAAAGVREEIARRVEEPWWERAKRRIAKKRLNQQDLRRVFAVETDDEVADYLAGRHNPSPEQWIALANAIGWSLDELLTGKKHPDADDVALAWIGIINRLSSKERAVMKAMLDPVDKPNQIS